MTPQEFKEYIVHWNNTFPLDYWYRKKYRIPFNSEKHREVSFIDIKFEYEEDLLINEQLKEEKRREERKIDYEVTGKLLSKLPKNYQIMSDEEVENWYEDLDIDNINQALQNKPDFFKLQPK